MCILFILFSFSTFAQIALNNSLTPQQLVQSVLVGGGVTITNVTYAGHATAIGEFANGGTTNIGLSRGVILASGAISNCVGPNSSTGAGSSLNTPGDPTLTAVANQTTYDAAVLEFDFIPLSDTIRFRYVFGSEEYPEYVNSFNDVFGFFINGPNPLGGNYVDHNIAIIPNTITPVSINNVNHLINTTYYVNNTGGLTIQYDGFTTVLTAWARVVPCSTYHFKIAIADAGDGVLDSGVFLEENSFSTNAVTVTSSYSVPGAGPIAIEGCNNALVKFSIPKNTLDTFWIRIDSIFGTAINGVDFPLIPDSIAILPGTKTKTLVIAPYIDGVIEGIEFVKLLIKVSICNFDTLVIPITDYTPVQTTTSPDTTVCQGTASLWVNAQNGSPPYTYSWTPIFGLTSINTATTSATPSATTLYYVEVSDTSGCPSVKDSVLVTVVPNPQVSFISDIFNGCEPIQVTFTDFSAPNIQSWHWDFGDGTSSNQQNPSHIYTAGTFSPTLTVTTGDGCKGSLNVPNLITAYMMPKAYFDAKPPVASVDYPNIKFTDLSQNAATWLWDFGDGNTSTDQNPEHTFEEGVWNVCLTVKTSNNCEHKICKDVRVVYDRISIYNIITPNGDGHNDVFIIDNIDKMVESHLVIFNRWGKKIFEASPYLNDWDAEGFADGAYFYVLKYKSFFKEDEVNGTITVMRGQ